MKKYLLDESKIQKLTELKGGCVVSDRILVDGAKVGYMYREEPSGRYPDTGWTFFAGDESEEYTSNADNFSIVEINTVCNYDDSIISKLNAEVGSAFAKNEKGEFVEEEVLTK